MRPTSANFFREFDAVTARRAFGVRWSVLVEHADATWSEYHATSETHGRQIADNAVAQLHARGATVWAITVGGTTRRRPLYEHFDHGAHYADDYEAEAATEAAYWDRDVEARNQPDS